MNADISETIKDRELGVISETIEDRELGLRFRFRSLVSRASLLNYRR